MKQVTLKQLILDSCSILIIIVVFPILKLIISGGLNAVNACDAWDLLKGKGAVIAVLDQGVDSKHREFENNYSSLSYDLVTKTTPTTVYGDHGTHVSGIIGANHNGRQIVGLAPEATLISLSHPLTIGTNAAAQMASSFGYAVAHGVDVINNSWGDQGGFSINKCIVLF